MAKGLEYMAKEGWPKEVERMLLETMKLIKEELEKCLQIVNGSL